MSAAEKGPIPFTSSPPNRLLLAPPRRPWATPYVILESISVGSSKTFHTQSESHNFTTFNNAIS